MSIKCQGHVREDGKFSAMRLCQAWYEVLWQVVGEQCRSLELAECHPACAKKCLWLSKEAAMRQ